MNYTDYTNITVNDEPNISVDNDLLVYEYARFDGFDGQYLGKPKFFSTIPVIFDERRPERLQALTNAKKIIAERIDVTYATKTDWEPDRYDRFESAIDFANAIVRDTYEMP